VNTAFVFAGGAALGALQAGTLRALYERGIGADLLIGTGMGAFNAAFTASRPETVETACELARVWRRLRREELFPVSVQALVGGMCGYRDHIVPDHGLRRLIERQIGFDDLADAATPVHVVAFDAAAGSEVLLSSGPATDAIVAAASIPGVFPPVQIGTRRLVDGTIVNHTPVSHPAELGAERIYVLCTRGSARPLEHAGRLVDDALDAARDRLAHDELARRRRLAGRQQIAECEPVADHDGAELVGDRMRKDRSGVNKGMKLAVLAARIDARRQVG
jgi:predicted acylesterase/phospholipase RssA